LVIPRTFNKFSKRRLTIIGNKFLQNKFCGTNFRRTFNKRRGRSSKSVGTIIEKVEDEVERGVKRQDKDY
jgi:hypothetical protein